MYIIIVAIIQFIGISKIISPLGKKYNYLSKYFQSGQSALFPIPFFTLRKTHLEFNSSLNRGPHMNCGHIPFAFHIT